MALSREYTMTINKKTSVLNKNLTISTNDKGIDIIFRLIDCPYISLSLKKNLYARVILLDPLGKQIDSDVTSIVENRVLFRLTKNLMSNITETGIYKLYIAIMDDKNNVNLLPPVKCTIEESDVEVRGLSVGLINQSGIDNALSTDYGSEISLFNADGSYNRTVWVSGDMITTARMNKLEDAVSNVRDHILAMEGKVNLPSERKDLVGTMISPIVIADLPKGFYKITGYVKDFVNKNAYQLTGENYFVVTYSDDRYSKMHRCLNTEKEFIRYKYEKVLETIYRNEQELVVCEQAEGYVRITLDEYQYIELIEDREVILPIPDGFTEVKVYVDAKQSETLVFNNVTWIEQPDLILGTMTVIYLSYINNKWYGGTNSFKDISDGYYPNTPPSINPDTPAITANTFRETLVVTSNGVDLKSTPIQDVTLYSNCTIRIPSEFDGKNITLNILSVNGLTVQFSQGTETHEVQLESDSLTVFNINIKSENSIISRINGGIGVTPEPDKVKYTIRNNLTNCSSSNTSTSITKGTSYRTNITANSGYTLGSITVTMNGNNITSTVVNGNNINIPNVTGDVIITCTATSQESSSNIYTVTNNLINCSSSNTSNSVTKGTSYRTNITANGNNVMNSISVLINGVDVTNERTTPIYGETTYTITKSLSNCSSSNTSTSITEGSSYTTNITANDGYTLSSITVVMGGHDVTSSVVNRNNINISNVTGNIVITAKAESSGFIFTKYKRLNDGVLVDDTDTSEATYHATVGMNPVEPSSNYTININSCNYICVCYYDEYKNYITYTEANTNDWSIKQLSTTIVTPSNARYIRVCATNSGSQIVGTLTKTINSGFTFTKYKKLNDGVLVDYTDESEVTYYATVNLNPVMPGSNYIISINTCTYICVCYYDESKNYLTYSEAHTDDWSAKQLSTTITIPSNARYIRVCATNHGTQVVGTLVKTDEIGGFTFTKYKRLDDGVLTDYTDTSEATYHATVNLNEVTPNANYIIKINSCNYICVCYYDENHNYISYTEAHTDDWSVKQLLTTIRIPSNIKYIRVSATNSGSQIVGVLTEMINGGGTKI